MKRFSTCARACNEARGREFGNKRSGRQITETAPRRFRIPLLDGPRLPGGHAIGRICAPRARPAPVSKYVGRQSSVPARCANGKFSLRGFAMLEPADAWRAKIVSPVAHLVQARPENLAVRAFSVRGQVENSSGRQSGAGEAAATLAPPRPANADVARDVVKQFKNDRAPTGWNSSVARQSSVNSARDVPCRCNRSPLRRRCRSGWRCGHARTTTLRSSGVFHCVSKIRRRRRISGAADFAKFFQGDKAATRSVAHLARLGPAAMASANSRAKPWQLRKFTAVIEQAAECGESVKATRAAGSGPLIEQQRAAQPRGARR